jgi:hypothetical protein
MKTKNGHTTNYTNAFIAIADDCPVKEGEMPPLKGDKKTVANLQFDMLYDHPYEYTSDDVIFGVYALRNEIKKSEQKAARAEFFSKGQPCMRTSPLAKRYGWGVHSDAEGRIAIYPCESAEYKKYINDRKLQVVKAMKTSR